MKVDLTPAKLAELKQKAEAAEKESPSPWHGGPDGDHWVLVDSQRGVFHTTCNERDSANFIAHADPATVLAMVEKIESLNNRLSYALEFLKRVYRIGDIWPGSERPIDPEFRFTAPRI